MKKLALILMTSLFLTGWAGVASASSYKNNPYFKYKQSAKKEQKIKISTRNGLKISSPYYRGRVNDINRFNREANRIPKNIFRELDKRIDKKLRNL